MATFRNSVSLAVKAIKLCGACRQSIFLKQVGHRTLYTSCTRRGLEEFFPKTDDEIEEGEATGTIKFRKNILYVKKPVQPPEYNVLTQC